jgi:hypothetical protein
MLKLFDIVVDEEKLHPNFKALLADFHTPARAAIEKWTDGFEDRDNKIVKEFQTSFNSSFWEFYIYAVLVELGFKIDFSHQRPDFCIYKNDNHFVLEATIASHAEGATPEWEKGKLEELTPEDIFTIENVAILRLANAISKKYTKYVADYSSLEHVKGKPFIICVAPFEQPLFFIQADAAIRRLLYKFNAPIYNKTEDGNVYITGKEYIDNVVKINDASVELGIFTDDRMKEVSAVIFSSTATITKLKATVSSNYENTLFSALRYQKAAWDTPYLIKAFGGDYHESMCDGLNIFVNPFAINPFDPNIFFNKDIALHMYDKEEKMAFTQLNDGHLFSHQSINFNISKEDIKKHVTGNENKEWNPVVAKQEDGILYPVNANVGLALNNHIARYNGWTVFVFMDQIDEDWGAIAKRLTVYKLQDFINSKNVESIMTDVSSPSKEVAFSEIKKLIDDADPH